MIDDRALKILVTRLTPEKTVSLSFSHKFILDLLERRFNKSVFVDYFFFPEYKKFISLKNNKFQGAVSQKAGIDISLFDIIAVSNSFQLELFNLFHLISILKAPFKLKDRLKDEKVPLIIAGGVNTPSIAAVTGAPEGTEGMTDDGSSSLIDAIFMGEAETNLPAFIQTLLNNPDWKKNKYELLGKASQSIAGVYFPPAYIHRFERTGPDGENALAAILAADGKDSQLKPVRSSYIENIDTVHEFNGAIFDDSPNGATVPVEISRGCASMCSFCKEGYTQKPYREKSADEVVKICGRLRDKTGISRFNLYSYNFSDHSHIHEIVKGLAERSMEAEVKSQRADTALKTPKLLSYLQSIGSASPTFAIEGISGRLRSYLSKNLDQATINSFADSVFMTKPRQIKLFFIITGLENESDLAEFNDFFTRLVKNRKNFSPSTSIVISLMPLVPCQKTPLMFAPAPDGERVYKIIDKISKTAGGCEKTVVRSSIGRKLYEITAIMEYGGREITRCLYDLAINGGFVYYEDIDDKAYNRFIQSVKKAGFAFSKFYGEKDMKTVFNSDDREYGVTKIFLYKAWISAKNFKDMPRCLRNSADKCCGCGACCGETAVYKNAGAEKNDRDFNIKRDSGANKKRSVLSVFIGDKIDIPHGLISPLMNGSPFKILEDSISKLSLNPNSFYGKNYYLIECPEGSAKPSKMPDKNKKAAGGEALTLNNPAVNDYKSFDFLLEYNYIFARVNFDPRFFKPGDTGKSAATLFSRLNPKFKPAKFKSDCTYFKENRRASGAAGFTCLTNADGLKKRPAMPVILIDNETSSIYALFKLDKEILDIIAWAEILEYVKFYDYNVKDTQTICGKCGRVMSHTPETFKSFSSSACFVCGLLS